MSVVWKTRKGVFNAVSSSLQGGTPSRYTLWGILNVTPDSFYDGGAFFSTEQAVEHGMMLIGQGARIVDIGGASSRPGASDISPDEELHRIFPVIKHLTAQTHNRSDAATLFSVDTWQKNVAAKAVEAGVDIINDVSACSWDDGLCDVLAQYKPGYVLTHCPAGSTPQNKLKPYAYKNIEHDVLAFFELKLAFFTKHGLPEDHIILDPGIGFGKTTHDSCRLLKHLDVLKKLGRPLLVGISNKSLFADLFGLTVHKRTEPTSVATALLAAQGIVHHRVHSVENARRALILAELFTPWIKL